VAIGASEQGAVEVPPLAADLTAPAPQTSAVSRADGGSPVASASPSAPPPPEAPAPSGGGQRTLGVVLAVAGGAGVATGVVLALLAQSQWSTAKTDCPGSLCPDAATRAKDSGAGGLADAATVGFAVGGVALAAGALLFFTAPSTPARVGIVVLPGGGAAAVGGAW
jgi:hypothetical protein